MLTKEQLKVLMPINLFHTMSHIFPYFLPILCQVIVINGIPISYTQTGIISMTSILVMVPLTIIVGFLGDRLRKWRFELIAIAYLLIVSHTFIIYVAPNFGYLVGASVVVGIGASVFHPIALPLLSQEFKEGRNYAHSINLIFGTFGSIITPIATIGLSNWLDWRTTTLIFGIFGAASFPILVVLLMLNKKNLTYVPEETIVMGEKVIKNGKTGMDSKAKQRMILVFITGPLIAIVIVNVLRAGIFRIMNTFTSFIFEDRFGASQFNSALIMSLILGMGGVAALISGFVSSKIGSLKTYIISMIATTIACVAVISFITALDITNVANSSWLLVIAIILFVVMTASFYFANPSANALLAELMPLQILSTVFGVITAIQIAFSSAIPPLFGLVVDQGYSLPYEYLIIFVLAIIPLALLLYVKKKIGFKTPDQVEKERDENQKKNSQENPGN
ncbi:MAG: MFS transporter [Candidatus Heimdallarchaeota archaeon]